MNPLRLLAVVSVLSATAMCFAQSQPAAQDRLPATRPATADPLEAARSPEGRPAGSTYSTVLVLPFTPVGAGSDWIGRGIQEDLATELVRQSRLSVLTPEGAAAPENAAAAIRAGQDQHASLVVFGTFQIVDDNVRISGQVADVADGHALAGLKATGPRKDLFHMEDVLAAQTVAGIPSSQVRPLRNAYVTYGPVTDYSPPRYGNAPYEGDEFSGPRPEAYAPAASYPTAPDYGYTSYSSAPYGGGYGYDYGYPYNGYSYGYYPYPFFGGFFLDYDRERHERDRDRREGDRDFGRGSNSRVGSGVSNRGFRGGVSGTGAFGGRGAGGSGRAVGGSGFNSAGHIGGGGGFHSGGGFHGGGGGGFHGGGHR